MRSGLASVRRACGRGGSGMDRCFRASTLVRRGARAALIAAVRAAWVLCCSWTVLGRVLVISGILGQSGAAVAGVAGSAGVCEGCLDLRPLGVGDAAGVRF